MVSVLIVSHSRKVAEGAMEMALAMSGDGIKIAAIGGNAEGGLGTDYDAILDKLYKLAEIGDVAVLADLGSAVMSVQAAIEQMGEDGKRVALMDAPLVEGAIVASVQASMGSNLQQIAQAAVESWSMRKLT